MTTWRIVAQALGAVPGLALTLFLVRCRRRRPGTFTRSMVLVPAALTLVGAAAATAPLVLHPAPVWLPWAGMAASVAIGYSYLVVQLYRHRGALQVPAAPAPERGP